MEQADWRTIPTLNLDETSQRAGKKPTSLDNYWTSVLYIVIVSSCVEFDYASEEK
jgi:hypothetical protein